MAKGIELEWPDDDAFVEGIVKAGAVVKYAERIGRPRATVESHVKRRRLSDRVRGELKAKREMVQEVEGVSELDVLRQKVRELESRGRVSLKDSVQEERVLRAVEQAVSAVKPPARVPPAARVGTRKHGYHRQLVAFSDWHGGEVVDREAMNGLNEYNWTVMEKRVGETVNALLSHKEHSPPLSGLDIMVVGDMISGNIHDELKETNEVPAAEQAAEMGYLLGRTIESLRGSYPNIRVKFCVGNHPRLPVKPAAKQPHNNLDWIVGTVCQLWLRTYPDVEVHVPKSAAFLHEIAGNTIYVWHGDGVRSSMPGVPWGGVMRRVNEIRRAWPDTPLDYFLLGHFHQLNAMHDVGVLMNGALKGPDEYSAKMFGGGSAPSQLLLTFSEKHKRLTDVRFLTPTFGYGRRDVA